VSARQVDPSLHGEVTARVVRDHWWMTRAACATRPDLPWTRDGHLVHPDARTGMAAVCRDCPVLARCDAYAASTLASAGFWAGSFRVARGSRDDEVPA
jgi:hypothetical protein